MSGARIILLDPPWHEPGGSGRGTTGKYGTDPPRPSDLWRIVHLARWPDGTPVFDPDPSGCLVGCWSTVTSRRHGWVRALFERLRIQPTGHEWVWCKGTPYLSSTAPDGVIEGHLAVDRWPGVVEAVAPIGSQARTVEGPETVHAGIRPTLGMGRYGRLAHEYIEFGRIGPLDPSELATKWPSWFIEPRPPGHSAKPDKPYRRIRAMLDGPAVAMFERRERAGFRVWGDEAPTDASSQDNAS